MCLFVSKIAYQSCPTPVDYRKQGNPSIFHLFHLLLQLDLAFSRDLMGCQQLKAVFQLIKKHREYRFLSRSPVSLISWRNFLSKAYFCLISQDGINHLAVIWAFQGLLDLLDAYLVEWKRWAEFWIWWWMRVQLFPNLVYRRCWLLVLPICKLSKNL